jgi:hypothetical protein
MRAAIHQNSLSLDWLNKIISLWFAKRAPLLERGLARRKQCKPELSDPLAVRVARHTAVTFFNHSHIG